MRLIDADALKEAIIELNLDNSSHWSVIYKINNAPTVDTYTEDDVQYAIKEGHQVGYEMAKAKFERPQGKWVDHSEDEGYLECPICGCLTTCNGNKEELHYCWHCGADMRGGRE